MERARSHHRHSLAGAGIHHTLAGDSPPAGDIRHSHLAVVGDSPRIRPVVGAGGSPVGCVFRLVCRGGRLGLSFFLRGGGVARCRRIVVGPVGRKRIGVVGIGIGSSCRLRLGGGGGGLVCFLGDGRWGVGVRWGLGKWVFVSYKAMSWRHGSSGSLDV